MKNGSSAELRAYESAILDIGRLAGYRSAIRPPRWRRRVGPVLVWGCDVWIFCCTLLLVGILVAVATVIGSFERSATLFVGMASVSLVGLSWAHQKGVSQQRDLYEKYARLKSAWRELKDATSISRELWEKERLGKVVASSALSSFGLHTADLEGDADRWRRASHQQLRDVMSTPSHGARLRARLRLVRGSLFVPPSPTRPEYSVDGTIRAFMKFINELGEFDASTRRYPYLSIVAARLKSYVKIWEVYVLRDPVKYGSCPETLAERDLWFHVVEEYMAGLGNLIYHRPVSTCGIGRSGGEDPASRSMARGCGERVSLYVAASAAHCLPVTTERLGEDKVPAHRLRLRVVRHLLREIEVLATCSPKLRETGCGWCPGRERESGDRGSAVHAGRDPRNGRQGA